VTVGSSARAEQGQQPSSTTTQAQADAAWAAYKSLPDDYPKSLPDTEREKWWEANFYGRVAPAALKFYTDFPGDPRRWEAAGEYVSIILNGLHTPEEATKAIDLSHQMMAATDVTESMQERVGFSVLRFELNADQNPSAAPADISSVEKELNAYAQKFPQAPNLFYAEKLYIGLVYARDPATAEADLHDLTSSQNIKVVEMAKGELRTIESRRKPLELKFTAVDGREVDLEKLRGKIVLVDFWATWCVPCKEELPNVKAVYEKYHDQGFEVVGISLDGAKDKQKLIDYCRDRGLPWPQYFDGKGWSNDVAKEFGVSEIPATFLLGKDGKIVSTDARGPLLEKEVRRELGF
jgi:thiol-disulfide isomerase/thioredoxin